MAAAGVDEEEAREDTGHGLRVGGPTAVVCVSSDHQIRVLSSTKTPAGCVVNQKPERVAVPRAAGLCVRRGMPGMCRG